MKLFTVVLAVTKLALVSAMTLGTDRHPSSLSDNGLMSIEGSLVPKQKDADASFCELIGRNSHFLYLETWGFNDESSRGGCGSALHDELVEQCCKHVNNWECRPVPDSHGVYIAFTFGIFCQRPKYCVEDSISAAAPESERQKPDIVCL